MDATDMQRQRASWPCVWILGIKPCAVFNYTPCTATPSLALSMLA